MSQYLIINLEATREQQRLIFWGQQRMFDSPNNLDALAVDEEYVNANLDRYDNGSTTRAILSDAVKNHTGDWRKLLGWPLNTNSEEGAAA